jgi:hypothetical protein
MEIHAPDHPPSTWKETGKHLAIITAGVLIALTLEGAVSWVDHRMLVREAVANLNAELRNNKKELDGLFANLKKEQKQLEHADEVAGVLLAHKPISTLELELESHGAELRNAAVTTGQITGAFGFMDYGDVRRYADIYDLQAQFMRLQEREGQHFLDVWGFVRRIASADRPADDAIQRWRAQIDVAFVGVVDREQLGRQLQKRYDETLAGR